jgi:hypothetical protein
MTNLRTTKTKKEQKYEFKLYIFTLKEDEQLNIAAKLNKYYSIQVKSDLFFIVCPEHVQLDSNAVDRRRSVTQN